MFCFQCNLRHYTKEPFKLLIIDSIMVELEYDTCHVTYIIVKSSFLESSSDPATL
jgi:hypothetical protein